MTSAVSKIQIWKELDFWYVEFWCETIPSVWCLRDIGAASYQRLVSAWQLPKQNYFTNPRLGSWFRFPTRCILLPRYFLDELAAPMFLGVLVGVVITWTFLFTFMGQCRLYKFYFPWCKTQPELPLDVRTLLPLLFETSRWFSFRCRNFILKRCK